SAVSAQLRSVCRTTPTRCQRRGDTKTRAGATTIRPRCRSRALIPTSSISPTGGKPPTPPNSRRPPNSPRAPDPPPARRPPPPPGARRRTRRHRPPGPPPHVRKPPPAPPPPAGAAPPPRPPPRLQGAVGVQEQQHGAAGVGGAQVHLRRPAPRPAQQHVGRAR